MEEQQIAEQRQNYYDSIETDEFVMPNKFDVEIRLADNQVSGAATASLSNSVESNQCAVLGENCVGVRGETAATEALLRRLPQQYDGRDFPPRLHAD